MADDVGNLIIKVEPEEAQLAAAFKKAGKEGGQQHVDKLSQGMRKLAGDAAAAVGGARGRGATNLIFAGGLNAKAAMAKAKGFLTGGGPAGLSGAGIGLIIVAATGAITLAVKALNKSTRASRDRLAGVTPILALSQAHEMVNQIRRNMIEGRLFGAQMARNNAKLIAASNELFKFKLAIKAGWLQVKTAAASFTLFFSKILGGLFDFINSAVIDAMLMINKILQLLGLTEGAQSLEELEAARRGETKGGAVLILERILREVQALRDQGDNTGINDIMLQEIRAMSGMQPSSGGRSPGRPVSSPGGGEGRSFIERAHRDMLKRRGG